MEKNKQKIKRFTAWGVFIIVIGGVAGYFLPEHSLKYFFELLKDVMANLII
jgi:hypothetical protein